jgi:anti-anti-sigma factor
MDIYLTQEDSIQVLNVDGRLDATSVANFDAEWKKLLDEGTEKLVVNFSNLEYISSAGLRGVLMLAKTAKMKKTNLVFAGMQHMVADMFRISGFASILQTTANVSEAVQKLK